MPKLPNIQQGILEGRFNLLDFEVQLGDAIIFNGMTVHGQSSNKNIKIKGEDQFRRIATRWTGDDARYILRKGEARDVIPSKFYPCTLNSGDRMECERFPKIWTKDKGLLYT